MRYPELELDENLQFQERLWQFERVGWWAATLLLLFGLLGGFGGSGPLSHTKLAFGGARVEFERFGRVNSQGIMTLSLDPKLVASGETDEKGQKLLEFDVSEDFFRYAMADQITPLPKKTTASGGKTKFYFAPDSGSGEFVVRFYFRYWRAGLDEVTFSTVAGQERLWRVIYP